MGEDGAEVPIGTIDQKQAVLPQREITPSPFTYERTFERDAASYHAWRVNPVRFDGKENPPRSDDEIIEEVKRDRESRDWFTNEYWREKGVPKEQVEFQVNGQ